MAKVLFFGIGETATNLHLLLWRQWTLSEIVIQHKFDLDRDYVLLFRRQAFNAREHKIKLCHWVTEYTFAALCASSLLCFCSPHSVH